MTWRQHRAQAAVGALVLLGFAAGLIVVGVHAHRTADRLGLPSCAGSDGDCSGALEQLHQSFHSLPPFTAALLALPLLAGMFWGAPLVSREYEAGTHRLAWTQSVSPLRWIVTKIVVIFAVSAAAAVTLGLLTGWALGPLAPAFGTRFNSTWFDIQGVLPIAIILFALAAGLAASALTRRTIPAMAIALVAFAAARIPMHFFRDQLAPVATRHLAFPMTALLQNVDSDGPPKLAGAAMSPNDWVLSTQRLDPAGHSISNLNNRGVLINYCPSIQPREDVTPAAIRACAPHLQGLTGSEVIRYQPAGHFWLIQATEGLIFLALAAALAGVAIYAVTRRRPT